MRPDYHPYYSRYGAYLVEKVSGGTKVKTTGFFLNFFSERFDFILRSVSKKSIKILFNKK